MGLCPLCIWEPDQTRSGSVLTIDTKFGDWLEYIRYTEHSGWWMVVLRAAALERGGFHWINNSLHYTDRQCQPQRHQEIILIPSSNYSGQGDYFRHRPSYRRTMSMNRPIEAERNWLWLNVSARERDMRRRTLFMHQSPPSATVDYHRNTIIYSGRSNCVRETLRLRFRPKEPSGKTFNSFVLT